MLNLTNVICPSFKNVTNRAINNLTIVLSSVQSVARFISEFFLASTFESWEKQKSNSFGLVQSPDLTIGQCWQNSSLPRLLRDTLGLEACSNQWWGSPLSVLGEEAIKRASNCTLQRHGEFREEDGRSPDTRLEGHLGRRQARDDSLIAQHMRLPIEGWTAIKVFVMLWSW